MLTIPINWESLFLLTKRRVSLWEMALGNDYKKALKKSFMRTHTLVALEKKFFMRGHKLETYKHPSCEVIIMRISPKENTIHKDSLTLIDSRRYMYDGQGTPLTKKGKGVNG